MGPGIGTLVGLAWGETLNERDFTAERARLAREAEEAAAMAMGSKAQKDAAKAVLNAVVTELQLEQQGKLKVRRLSEPGNLAGRNEAFMDTAEGQLNRLSGGALAFTKATPLGVKGAKKEMAEVLQDPLLAPKVSRIAKR